MNYFFGNHFIKSQSISNEVLDINHISIKNISNNKGRTKWTRNLQ